MKKLLGILVLGLFLSSNAYAEKIKLSCERKFNTLIIAHSVILDPSKEELFYDGVLAKTIIWGRNAIWFSHHERGHQLDRVTGYLDNEYKCKKVRKNVF